MVTKDKSEFNNLCPVACELENKGHEVLVVAEGLSMDEWIKSGRQIYGGLPRKGTFDPNTKMRTGIDPQTVFWKFCPDLLITGLGSPIHLGEKFGLAANSLRVKLVYIEDVWGVHKRSRAVPDLVCTVDPYGVELVDDHYRQVIIQSGLPKVFITGAPAMDNLTKVVPDPLVKNIIDQENFDRVILIGGQDESTTPVVNGIVNASKLSDLKWLILPRFHPKWMTDESKTQYRDEWIRLLGETPSRHKVLWTPNVPDMRTLIPLATCVVSTYSTCLIEAPGLGSASVSWISQIGMQKTKQSLGVEEFPAISMGACSAVFSPEQFVDIVSQEDFAYDAALKLWLDGRATERVVEVLTEEME
jgi:hypothetical protein